MRFDPLNIVLNTKIKLEKKFYFISGNEISLIEKVKSTVVNNYKSKQSKTLSWCKNKLTCQKKSFS